MFSLELAEDVSDFVCSCCGKPFQSVCGFITKDGDAYSTYFATLQTGHEEIAVGLTISIGKWWDDDASDERTWIYLTVQPSETDFNMTIEEPEQSRHSSFKPLGIGLSRKDALVSPLRDEFFEVADFVVDQDPSVNSYLSGKEINIAGRACRR